MKGIITKGIGGLYTVMADGEKFECSVRGKFRQKDMMTPLVGDRVEINKVDDELYAIDEIYERKNELGAPERRKYRHAYNNVCLGKAEARTCIWSTSSPRRR